MPAWRLQESQNSDLRREPPELESPVPLVHDGRCKLPELGFPAPSVHDGGTQKEPPPKEGGSFIREIRRSAPGGDSSQIILDGRDRLDVELVHQHLEHIRRNKRG